MFYVFIWHKILFNLSYGSLQVYAVFDAWTLISFYSKLNKITSHYDIKTCDIVELWRLNVMWCDVQVDLLEMLKVRETETSRHHWNRTLSAHIGLYLKRTCCTWISVMAVLHWCSIFIVAVHLAVVSASRKHSEY